MTRKTPRFLLSVKQRQVMALIERFVNATGEPCSGSFLARSLRVHHSTVQAHLGALHRKGWLRAPNPPAFPSRLPRKDRGTAHFADS